MQSGVLSIVGVALPLHLISNAKLHPQQSMPNVQKKSGLFFNALISTECLPYPDTRLGEQETRALAFVHNQAGQAI